MIQITQLTLIHHYLSSRVFAELPYLNHITINSDYNLAKNYCYDIPKGVTKLCVSGYMPSLNLVSSSVKILHLQSIRCKWDIWFHETWDAITIIKVQLDELTLLDVDTHCAIDILTKVQTKKITIDETGWLHYIDDNSIICISGDVSKLRELYPNKQFERID
jgi:hypothetical protein